MHLASVGCELKYNVPWMSRKVYNSPLPSRMTLIFQDRMGGFPGGSVVESLPASVGDMGLIPDPR